MPVLDDLDRAIRDADPLGGRAAGGPHDPDARAARARIVAGHVGPSRARRLVGLGAGLAGAATLGALVGALIVAAPGTDDDPGPAPGATTTVPVPVPQPNPPPPPPAPTAPVAPVPPTVERVENPAPPDGPEPPIALLRRAGVPPAQIPDDLFRTGCGIYTDRVHLIATSPMGNRVWVAWGADRQVTWWVENGGRGGGGGGGCSSLEEVVDRRAIVLSPDVGPTVTRSDGTVRRPDPARFVAGFAVDGIDRAEVGGIVVPVTESAFTIRSDDPIRRVTVTGPAGTRTVRLG